jgi:glycosyltransferase involved in cell wall biosynthesis
MRILFLALSYPPETKASDDRLYNLAVQFQRLGHEVSILSASANSPSEEVFEEFRTPSKECNHDIKVIRAWVLPTKRSSLSARFLSNLSFLFSASLVSAWKTGPIDVVLVQSPPLFAAIAGLAIARLRAARLVLNISDLWPETLVVLGLLRNRIVIRLAGQLEEFLCRKADLIIGQTLGIVRSIERRCPGKRVVLSTCGANVRQYPEHHRATRAGKEQDFIVGFVGQHGRAQALENVLRAAQILSDNRHIRFRFFGDGSEKPALLKLREELGLAQVEFYDSQPKSRMPEIVAAFDASLVPLRNGDLFRETLPAKMFEAMAAGIPIVLSADGEARGLVQAAGAAICVEPENPEALAQAISDLYKSPALARELGLNGRRYAMEHFDWQTIAAALEPELSSLCSPE